MTQKLSIWINQTILWSLIAAVMILVITSLMVRDYAFIVNHPKKFMWELMFFSVIPSLMIALVFAKTRKIPVKDTVSWFVALVVKFAIFHVLFQMSGVYTVLFTMPV